MINAFAINDSRLLRIDDEPAELSSAIWLDLLEPTGEEREMLQEGLGQSLASFLELEDIEASARFFEDETACTCTHSSIVKTKKLRRPRERSIYNFVMAAYLPCVIVSYRHSVYIVCVLVASAYWNVMRMKFCSTYLKPKIEQLADVIENVYADLEKLSRVILNGTQDEAFDEALNTLTEQEDTSSKVRLC